jgi:molecular chaperone DnaJ
MKDYYDILGVNKDSSDQEIKKAYRKIAMKNHPDRNPGDEGAEEKFKQAAEAYSVLSNSQKKQQYDRFGHDAFNQQQGFGGGMNVEDIFSSFGDIFGNMGFGDIFGGGSSSRGRRTAGDLRITLKLTLEEMYAGVNKKVRIKKQIRNNTEPIVCSKCEGSGEVRVVQKSFLGQIVNVQPCRSCNGMGRLGGVENSTTLVEIEVPSGVGENSQMTMRGEGNQGFSEQADGNLIIQFSEIEHDIFIRNDLDVYLQCDIQYQHAVIGTTIDIPTLEGEVKLTIPPGLNDGQVLRLKNKGFKQPNGHRVGNQYVKIMINIPKKISKKTHKLLGDISSEIGDQVIFRRFSE